MSTSLNTLILFEAQAKSPSGPRLSAVENYSERLYKDGFHRLLNKTYVKISSRKASRSLLHSAFFAWRGWPSKRMTAAIVSLFLLFLAASGQNATNQGTLFRKS